MSEYRKPILSENGHEIITYKARCGHVDHRRPPSAEDPFEFHWRCPATFEEDTWTETDNERLYCLLHRPLYRHGPPATSAEVHAAVEAFGHAVRHWPHPMRQAHADEIEEKLLTDADYAAWRAKKDAQLNAAKKKGLL